MDENFEGQGRTRHSVRAVCAKRSIGGQRTARSTLRVLNLLNLRNRTFAREDDEVAAEVAGELHTRRTRDGHLSRAVNGEVWREFSDEPTDAHVLHDGGVHASGDDGTQIIRGVGEFVLEDERVECDVALHAAPVEELHQLGQIRDREIMRPHPRIEFFEAEVNRVRTVLDGSLGAFPIASGREKLG